MKRFSCAVVFLFILSACPLWAQQTLSKIYICPGSVSLKVKATQQFKVVGLDATGAEVPITLPVTWAVMSGAGQITTDGLYTATTTQNTRYPKAVQVTVGQFHAFASVDVVDDIPVNSRVGERSWGAPGPGQFHGASGIAAAGSYAYIADTKNHRIQQFTISGQFSNQWGGYGSGNGEFKFPRDIKIGPNGNVYVADTGNNRIQVFDALGRYMRQFGTYGAEPGQFSSPSDVAVAADGTTYVVDTNNHRIQKFGANGVYVSAWGSQGAGDGQFDSPASIAVFGTAVYVADTNNHRIQKFDLNGQFITKWGSEGTGPGQFSNMQGINTTANGYLLVADGTRVQSFDPGGNLMTVYGAAGTCDGGFVNVADAVEMSVGILALDSELDRAQIFYWTGGFRSQWGAAVASAKGELANPQGVAVDVLGYVYTADTENGRIQVFDRFGQFVRQFGLPSAASFGLQQPTALAVDTSFNTYVIDGQKIVKFDSQGRYVTEWGSYGSGDRQFKDPKGIAVDALGNVYVADTGNDRIQKYGPSGNFIMAWGTTGVVAGPYFSSPVSVAVDSLGCVYVLDKGNSRFQKFKSNGEYLLDCKIPIVANSQLSALAVDTDFSVFVTDAANCTVQVFSPYVSSYNSTSYLQGPTWGTPGSVSAFSMQNPSSIAVSRWGHLFIADAGNNRIKKLAANISALTVEPFEAVLMCGSRQDFSTWGSSACHNPVPLEGPIQWMFGGRPSTDGSFTAGGSPGTTYVSATYERTSGSSHVVVQIPIAQNGYITERLWYNTSLGVIESIAIDDNDNIYTLSKYGTYAIRQYDRYGKVLAIWGPTSKQSVSDPSFANGIELRVDSQGNVYILDNVNCDISKFDCYGNLLKKWGTKGYSDGQMYSPQGMALDSQGYIYICDTSNNRVQKFTSDGEFVSKWTILDMPAERFRGPWSIAVGPQNTIYVCEITGRILKLDCDGNYITQWGSTGTGDGQFRNPKGIAVDSAGNVFVADTYNNRVQKFDSNGNFITSWNRNQTGDGLLNAPTCIAVDSQGGVYVSDTYNYRIRRLIQGSSSASDVKKLPEGTPVSLIGQGVTAGSREMTRGFYVESPDRSSGILVTGVSADRNAMVMVRGTVQKVAGEYAVGADQVTVIGQSSMSPLGMNASQLGGGSFGHQEGVWGWRSVKMPDGRFQRQWMELSGLNNIGLLVKVWGKVKSVDLTQGLFFIDDGFGGEVKCLAPQGLEGIEAGSCLSLTGISSCEYDSQGSLVPVLRLRDAGDVMILNQ